MYCRQAEKYLDSLYKKDDVLQQVADNTRRLGMPEIAVTAGTGRLLTLLANLSGARRALEIGTLGGYSAICIARGLPADGHLTTLELNPDFARAARDHVALAGLAGKVAVRTGDAGESLDRLAEERARFGFFFIDADKFNYPRYLEGVVRVAEPGALVVADNILSRGRVFDPEQDTVSVAALRQFNRTVAADGRFESALLPVYDGLALLRIKV